MYLSLIHKANLQGDDREKMAVFFKLKCRL